MTTSQPSPDWIALAIKAGSVFTPAVPIDARSLFTGRQKQVRLIVDAVNQRGQHAVLYGERGVGKTSLANVLATFLGDQGKSILSPRVNCDSADTFESVWRKVFEEMQLTRTLPETGFGGNKKVQPAELLGKPGFSPVTPDTIRRALTLLSQNMLPILIIDEFDRLSKEARRAFADAIKMLSDHSVRATVVLVGVADSVDQLIAEHESVERALVQVHMERMSPTEVSAIITTGLAMLEMTIEDDALKRVTRLSQGFPHYAHLLGLYASRAALDGHRKEITMSSVDQAIDRALTNAQQSIRNSYELAVRSPRKHNLYTEVLLACAMLEGNEFGYFAAQDIRDPLRRITGKAYDIPNFATHLSDFCEKKGPVLERTGVKRLYRYRFRDPLLQPFVLMQGLKLGKITSMMLDEPLGQTSLKYPTVPAPPS